MSERWLRVNEPIGVSYPNSEDLELPKEVAGLETTSQEQAALPVRDAKHIGDETLDLFGQSIRTHVYQWTTALESGPAEVKGWFSDSFPGRQIRLEFDLGGNSKAVEEVVLFEAPGS